jgi:hypothetical protein
LTCYPEDTLAVIPAPAAAAAPATPEEGGA